MKALSAAFALFVATPLLAADPTNMTPTISEGRVVTWQSLDGGAAGKMTVWVWLPPEYGEAKGKRFPVLYMHDGQNLFDKALTAYNQEWQMDEAIPRMARQGDLRSWIVVGVQSPKARYTALFPQKLFSLLSADYRKRVEGLETSEPKGALAGDEYLKFMVGTVKARVDREFRTLEGPEDTAVMGSSMGGLMAFYAMAEYPGVFGQAAAVSMHIPLAGVERGEDHSKWAAESTDAFRRYIATSGMKPGKNRLYVDHGTATLDEAYAPYSKLFIPMLEAAGWTGSNVMFRTYAGAEHNETAWAQRVDIPLAFLDRKDP